MSKSNKRTFADMDPNPLPTSKKARNAQHAAPLPPAPHSASRHPSTPSSPTLIGSAPTSPPPQSLPSTTTDATDSGTSSNTSTSSSSSEVSSSDSSSSNSSSSSSASLPPNHNIPQYPGIGPRNPNSTSTTSGTETSSDSPTSTSASISDDVPGSSSPSSSEISESPSPKTSAGTLTAKNLSVLQKRLDSLLPRLQSANAQLEVERWEGRLGERNIENVTEEDVEAGGKGYIEMALGLGVLEERRREEAGSEVEEGGSESDSDSDSGRRTGSESSSEGSSGREDAVAGGEEDVVAKLMGARVPRDKRKIKFEEVGG